jgi:Rad3-related DNA helicase
MTTKTLSIPEPSEINLRFPEWRDGQLSAIEWIAGDNWFEHDAEFEHPISKVMVSTYDNMEVKVLEGPTGTGKTGIIIAAALLSGKRVLIMCATKIEQQQYMNNLINSDINDVVTVMGKGNFHCVLPRVQKGASTHACEEQLCSLVHKDEAPCAVDGFQCPVRSSCPYDLQKARAVGAQVVVTNYAYGLAMLNYVGAEGGLGVRDIIVSDEGHVLDEMLEQFISIRISKRVVDRLFNVSLPKFKDGGDIPNWIGWVEDNEMMLKQATDKYEDIYPEDLNRVEMKDYLSTYRYLDYFRTIAEMDQNWVVEEDSNMFTFQPVWVTGDSRRVLFNHAGRHVIMSGTIPSPIELGNKVGLRADEFSFYRLPYTFPPENRPIILRPRVDLSWKNKAANMPLLVEAVDETLEEYLKVKPIKILIHTKSYDIARYLEEWSEYGDIFLLHNTRTRNSVLEAFKSGDAPLILASPSFDKAVDLPGNECELIIIAKVPYPYLGSKVMKRRSKNRRYYTHETLMTLIQMAGRGVRSEQDVCPTIVLDAAGPKFFKQARRMTPKGIQNAIIDESDASTLLR